MNDGVALETLRLTRATYDATVSNLFVNMEILRLTERILAANLQNVALQQSNHETLSELTRYVRGDSGERTTEGT